MNTITSILAVPTSTVLPAIAIIVSFIVSALASKRYQNYIPHKRARVYSGLVMLALIIYLIFGSSEPTIKGRIFWLVLAGLPIAWMQWQSFTVPPVPFIFYICYTIIECMNIGKLAGSTDTLQMYIFPALIIIAIIINKKRDKQFAIKLVTPTTLMFAMGLCSLPMFYIGIPVALLIVVLLQCAQYRETKKYIVEKANKQKTFKETIDAITNFEAQPEMLKPYPQVVPVVVLGLILTAFFI